MAKRTIIAIGGGSIRRGTTLKIDRAIIKSSGKTHPRLLFIPTASSDSKIYWEAIQKHFGKKLGCKTDVLWLLHTAPKSVELRKKILSADIIYVGGGNTLKMMRRWRLLGIDTLLSEAWNRGIVLCGVSAGSICWFEAGHSDSMSFYNSKKWEYVLVQGLGFLPWIHCPHFHSATLGKLRSIDFEQMIRKRGGTGLGIDDLCAVVFTDTGYQVISASDRARAYLIRRRRGNVFREALGKRGKLKPMHR